MPPASPSRFAVRRALPAAVLALVPLLTACGTTTPTPTPTAIATVSAGPATPSPTSQQPSVDPAQVYASIEAQVEQIRELRPKAAETAPTLLDAAGVRSIVEQQFAKSNPKTQLDANEMLLKALGLLPAQASLEKLETDLLSSQVAGMYDPDTKKLYVVSKAGTVGPTEKVTFSHEFTHELQDQNFGLKGLATDQIGQGDQDLGRLALVEGDATLVMTIWEQGNLTTADLTQLAAESFDPTALATLAAMPPILRETLLFPYTAGLTFVSGLSSAGGWAAVNAAFRAPPDSTEQILHPAKYASHEKPIPVALPGDLPGRLGAGWTSPLQDTLGELQLRIWLQGGVPFSEATDAAAGWGGDRVELLTGPGGAWAVVLGTAWDTAADAAQFETAALAEAARLGSAALLPAASGGPAGTPAGLGPTVLVASDAATLAALRAAVGTTVRR